jgi:hypothetical protein
MTEGATRAGALIVGEFGRGRRRRWSASSAPAGAFLRQRVAFPTARAVGYFQPPLPRLKTSRWRGERRCSDERNDPRDKPVAFAAFTFDNAGLN